MKFSDLEIPEIEIHEIGRLITPRSERKNFSTESSVQRSNSIETKIIPEIIPIPGPQVLSEDIDSSFVIDLKTFNWSNFDKVNSKTQITLIHDQLILAFKEIIRINKAIKSVKTKTNYIVCFQILLICAIIAIILMQTFL